MRILILFMLPIGLRGQEEINLTQFMDVIVAPDIQMDGLTQDELKLPWIEVYEFRTETRDFDLDKQEYTVRLTPNSIKKRKAQKAYYDLIKHTPDFEGLKFRCDRIYNAYEDWLLMLHIRNMIDVFEELEVILSDKKEVHRRMSSVFQLDSKKFTELQKDFSEVKISKHDLQLQLQSIKSSYGIIDKNINSGDLISIQTIENRIRKLKFNREALQNPKDAFEQEMIDRELKIEKAEDQQIFDFAQLRYQGPHEDQFQERLSLGLGLRIPNQGNRKMKIKELELERDRNSYIQNIKIDQDIHQLQNKMNEIEYQIELVRFVVAINQTERKELETISQNISKEEGFDPLFLLDIAERKVTMKLNVIEKESQIFMAYLDLWDEANQLCPTPFSNVLID